MECIDEGNGVAYVLIVELIFYFGWHIDWVEEDLRVDIYHVEGFLARGRYEDYVS